MSIKEKYMDDFKDKTLDAEFKKNLADMMNQKFDSDDDLIEDMQEVGFTSEEITLDEEFKKDLTEMMNRKFDSDEDLSEDKQEADYISEESADIETEIIHTENRSRFRILRYIASSAAVLALAASSVLLFRDNIPEHTLTTEAESTTVTYLQYNETATEKQAALTVSEKAVTTAAVTTVKDITAVSVPESLSSENIKPEESETKKTDRPVSESVQQNNPVQTKAAEQTTVSVTSVSEPAKTTAPSVTTVSETTEPAVTTEPVPVSESEKADDKYFKISIANINYLGNGYYKVYYRCDTNSDISGFAFYPVYDKSHFTFISAEQCLGEEFDDVISVYDNSIVMLDTNNHVISGNIAVYTFQADENIPEGQYEFGYDTLTFTSGANYMVFDDYGTKHIKKIIAELTPAFVTITAPEETAVSDSDN